MGAISKSEILVVLSGMETVSDLGNPKKIFREEKMETQSSHILFTSIVLNI